MAAFTTSTDTLATEQNCVLHNALPNAATRSDNL